MTTLMYDPADGVHFWESIRELPGFPVDETMPIQEMIFESDALFRMSDVLKKVGAQQAKPLIIVMDETPMLRNGENLKELILGTLQSEGWQTQVTWMRADESGQVNRFPTWFFKLRTASARIPQICLRPLWMASNGHSIRVIPTR